MTTYNEIFNYQKLFSVSIENAYYDVKYQQDFDILPLPETSEFMRNHGLLLKQTEKGIVVLAKSELSGSHYKIIKDLALKSKLSFKMVLKNPLFHNFSDIPMDGNEGQLFYFHNHTSNVVSGALHLAPVTAVKDGTIRIEKGASIVELSSIANTNVITLEDKKMGTVVLTKVIDDTKDVLVNGTYQFDLRSETIPSGYYDVKVGGDLKESFYLDKDAHNRSAFGIIELFNDSSIPAAYQFIDFETQTPTDIPNGSILAKDYVVSFGNRSVLWKYNVKVRNKQTVVSEYDTAAGGTATEVSNLTISDIGSVKIEQLSPAVLATANNGEREVYFHSITGSDVLTPIALSQKVTSGIQLKLGSDILANNLPNAGISSITKDSGGNLQSEITVIV